MSVYHFMFMIKVKLITLELFLLYVVLNKN